MQKVVILGAGFAGLQLASRLSEEVPGEVDVTIIDKNDAFVFGFSKLDLMYDRADLDEVRLPYSLIDKPSVRFVRETILSIDPQSRRVVTGSATYDADILVVALGADLDPAATPGVVEEGTEYYSVEGANHVRSALSTFQGGDAVVGVLGNFFKCPAAPFETAIMLHDYLEKRGLRDKSTIKVISPMPKPIPISDQASEGILQACGERDIGWWPQLKATALDPSSKTATLSDGQTIPYSLFLAIPVHRAPTVVEKSSLVEEDGWIAVDHQTFATKFENVYAVGDVTSAPVPRVGVMAEGEADTLADVLVHQLRGGEVPKPFLGKVTCYIEFGGPKVARFEGDFLSGPKPIGTFTEASEEIAALKVEFGASRRRRWFGMS